MMTSIRRCCLGAGLVAALALTACGNDDTPEDNGEETGVATPADDDLEDGELDPPADDGALDDATADDDADESEDDTTDDEGEAEPREFDVDVSESHPNGVVAQISRVILTSNTIELEGEILNSSPDLHILADIDNELRVVDDLGNAYPFSGEAGEHGLEVEGNESLEGRLVFLGRLSPDATELTVEFYGGEGPQAPHDILVDMDVVIPVEPE